MDKTQPKAVYELCVEIVYFEIFDQDTHAPASSPSSRAFVL